jgi:hypothetical protein
MYGGGLAGVNLGHIGDCYATGDIDGSRYNRGLGGLVGEDTFTGVITSSYATGHVSAEDGGFALGGLVGVAMGDGIYNCYSAGSVRAGDNSSLLGGLVGDAMAVGIANCYSSVSVSAGPNSTHLGGLVGGGRMLDDISGCFWDVEASGLSESIAGTGLTTAQMQDRDTFLAAGWDFAGERVNGTADLWIMPEEGGYPRLAVLSDTFDTHKLQGTGTPDDPYTIATAQDLGAISHHNPSAWYRLTADIDLAGSTWHTPPIPYFHGSLDGAGFVVSNLTVRGGDRLGLFGELDADAVVKDLGIHDADIVGTSYLGALAAVSRGAIAGCYACGTVVGNDTLGMLVGWNGGTISNSYSTGALAGEQLYCAGGLVGASSGTIDRCYSGASVSWAGASESLGGLVGSTDGDTVSDSYFLIHADAGGPDNSIGLPLTEEQMTQQASFVGWDFESIWTICEGEDYPRLWWERVQCGP